MVTNRENQLESDRGYYYANDRTVICVDRVEIRSEEYDLTGDSVVYNLTTDHAYYFRHTNIWNTQGDYLLPTAAATTRAANCIPSLKTAIYPHREAGGVERFDRLLQTRGTCRTARQYQIDDTEHKVLAFGDFGEYWKEPGNAFHAPPRGGELRYVAGRFALHGGRLDVPLYDRSGQAARRFVARRSPCGRLRCTPTRCVPIHCVSIRWRPPPGDSVQGVRPEAPIVAARRGSLSGGAGRRETERNGAHRILWRRDGRTACAGILWRRIRCMSTRSFGIRCSRIRW